MQTQGKISSSVSFHQYFQVFLTKLNSCLTFGVAKNDVFSEDI